MSDASNDMNDRVEEEALDVDEPQRREQSAEFAISDDAGSHAQMRQAMDPANQSLADALRLSYRILQTAIVGLAIVFVFSGFQTVAENSTGVRTLFGAIEGKGDDAQLEPGLQPFWPYPIGEIVTVQLRRNVRIDHAFWPRLASDQMTIDQATDAASVNTPIRPGGDGSLMLRNGDLAHARIEAEYEIEDAVAFLDQFTPEQADEVVKLSLERASVQVAASSTLTSFLEQREEANANIASIAQATLDDIGTGIRLVNVSLPDRIAPLAVRKSVEGVQQARERAKTAVEVARSDAAKMIAEAVGPTAYGDLVDLINAYESELSRGDRLAADAVLETLNKRFEADDISGEAAQILAQARTYRSMIESTLGNDVRRLAGLVPAFEENPKQLVRQLWLEAYQQVLNNAEAEVFSMPPGIGGLALSVTSSQEVSTLRRDAAVERAKNASAAGLYGANATWQLGSRQISVGKAGRRLNRDASTGFGRKEQ